MEKINIDISDIISELCSSDLGKALYERAQLTVITRKQNEVITDLENKINGTAPNL